MFSTELWLHGEKSVAIQWGAVVLSELPKVVLAVRLLKKKGVFCLNALRPPAYPTNRLNAWRTSLKIWTTTPPLSSPTSTPTSGTARRKSHFWIQLCNKSRAWGRCVQQGSVREGRKWKTRWKARIPQEITIAGCLTKSSSVCSELLQDFDWSAGFFQGIFPSKFDSFTSQCENACWTPCIVAVFQAEAAGQWGENVYENRKKMCKIIHGFYGRAITINRAMGYIASGEHRK